MAVSTCDPGQNPLRLALVDDSAVFRRTLQAYLEKQRPWPIVASISDGRFAVQSIQKFKPDVVLLDITLPGMGGLEIAKLLQALSEPPAFVFLTLHDSIAFRDQARTLGAAGYVVKDQLVEHLLPLLDRIAAERRGRDDNPG